MKPYRCNFCHDSKVKALLQPCKACRDRIRGKVILLAYVRQQPTEYIGFWRLPDSSTVYLTGGYGFLSPAELKRLAGESHAAGDVLLIEKKELHKLMKEYLVWY